jgi:hypothetical protein
MSNNQNVGYGRAGPNFVNHAAQPQQRTDKEPAHGTPKPSAGSDTGQQPVNPGHSTGPNERRPAPR